MPIAANPDHLAADIAALSAAFPDEQTFLGALRAVLRELRSMLRNPTEYAWE